MSDFEPDERLPPALSCNVSPSAPAPEKPQADVVINLHLSIIICIYVYKEMYVYMWVTHSYNICIYIYTGIVLQTSSILHWSEAPCVCFMIRIHPFCSHIRIWKVRNHPVISNTIHRFLVGVYWSVLGYQTFQRIDYP
jgi:hypothetical protein